MKALPSLTALFCCSQFEQRTYLAAESSCALVVVVVYKARPEGDLRLPLRSMATGWPSNDYSRARLVHEQKRARRSAKSRKKGEYQYWYQYTRGLAALETVAGVGKSRLQRSLVLLLMLLYLHCFFFFVFVLLKFE